MSGKNLSHIIISTHLLQSLLLSRLSEAESLLPGLGARPLCARDTWGPRPSPRPRLCGEHRLRVPGGVGSVLAAAPLHTAVDSLHDVSRGQSVSFFISHSQN